MKKRYLPTVGAGHGGNSKLPAIREVVDVQDPRQRLALSRMQPGTRIFRMGRAQIFVSPPQNDLGWHLSISRPDRYPSWDEVAGAWYALVPEAERRTGAMILPPLAEYVNIHDYCFQVHELRPDGTRMYISQMR